MKKTPAQYIRLFHGRKDPAADPDPTGERGGWGEDGPVIGPVGLSWTYGTLKIHEVTEQGWGDPQELPMQDDLIGPIGGSYYGDMEVWSEGDTLIADAYSKGVVWSIEEANQHLSK